MLWFQGAIPAAIASAKRSGAVFVVFVAGEGGGGLRYGRTPSPAYLQPQSPTAFGLGLLVPGISAPSPSVWGTAGLAPFPGTVPASPPKR